MNFWPKIEGKKLSMQFMAIILKNTLTKEKEKKILRKK